MASGSGRPNGPAADDPSIIGISNAHHGNSGRQSNQRNRLEGGRQIYQAHSHQQHNGGTLQQEQGGKNAPVATPKPKPSAPSEIETERQVQYTETPMKNGENPANLTITDTGKMSEKKAQKERKPAEKDEKQKQQESSGQSTQNLGKTSEGPVVKDAQKSQQVGQTATASKNEKADTDNARINGNKSEPGEDEKQKQQESSGQSTQNLGKTSEEPVAKDVQKSQQVGQTSSASENEKAGTDNARTNSKSDPQSEPAGGPGPPMESMLQDGLKSPANRFSNLLMETNPADNESGGEVRQNAVKETKKPVDDKKNENKGGNAVGPGQAQSSIPIKISSTSFLLDGLLSEDSCIYKGRERSMDGEFRDEIAVKLIPARKKKKFVKESESMRHVTGHPNVVRFFHCGRDENDNTGDCYIVMDLCQKALENITSDERKIFGRRIFVQICRGVQHLHDRKVAHGDLRPSHILFSRDGKNAVIAGFGRSRKFKEGEDPVSCFGEDIFRLGCLGVYVLTSFAEGHTESYWDANSHKMSTPKLDGLGPLEKDLFKRMLSHVPEERPSIDKVLHHCMFWSRKKTSQFLHDVYSYSRLSESLSEPLLLIDRYCRDFQSVLLQNVEKNQLLMSSHSQQLANEAGIPGDWLKEVIRIRSWETEGQKEEEQTFNHLLRRKLFLNGGLKNLLHQWESERLGRRETLCNQVKKWYNETKRLIGLERRRKWYMLGYLTDSSLKELLRYLRNNIEHCGLASKIKELLDAFPKLVPFLLCIMEPELEEEDKEAYMLAMPRVENLCLT